MASHDGGGMSAHGAPGKGTLAEGLAHFILLYMIDLVYRLLLLTGLGDKV